MSASHHHTTWHTSSSTPCSKPYCSSCTSNPVSTVSLSRNLTPHFWACHPLSLRVWTDLIFSWISSRLWGSRKVWVGLSRLWKAVGCRGNVVRWIWRCCSRWQWRRVPMRSHGCRGSSPIWKRCPSRWCCVSRRRAWRRCRCCLKRHRRRKPPGAGGVMTRIACGDRAGGSPGIKK